jgi:predicted secreted protein
LRNPCRLPEMALTRTDEVIGKRRVAPNPVRDTDTMRAKQARRRKARMDQRTRERLPALPAMAECAVAQHKSAAERLAAATAAESGSVFHVGAETWRRTVMAKDDYIKVWAHDLATGRRVV